MSDNSNNKSGVDFNSLLVELLEKTSGMDREKFEEEIRHEMAEQSIQHLTNDFFPTYNFLIAQAGKLFTTFEQDRFEVATAVSIMAGLCLGSMAGDKKDVMQGLLGMTKVIAETVSGGKDQEELSNLFANIMSTAQVVEAKMMLRLLNKTKNATSESMDPLKGDFYKQVMQGAKSTTIKGDKK